MNSYSDSMIILGSNFTPSDKWKEREYKPTYHPFYRPESAIFRDERMALMQDIQEADRSADDVR